MEKPRTAKQILDQMPARERERMLRIAEWGKQRTRIEQARTRRPRSLGRPPKTKTATDLIRAMLREMPDKTASSAHVHAVLDAALPGISDGTIQKAKHGAPVHITRHGDGTTNWTLIELMHKPMRLPDE